MIRIVICVSGGNVQEIVTDQKEGLEVILIDADNQPEESRFVAKLDGELLPMDRFHLSRKSAYVAKVYGQMQKQIDRERSLASKRKSVG